MGMAQGYSMSFEADSGKAPMTIDQLKRESDRLRKAWEANRTPETLAAAKEAALNLRLAQKQAHAIEEKKAARLKLVAVDWSRQQAELSPVRVSRGAALVDPENKKAGKGTGVKHIKQTISGFTHGKPDKAEMLFTKVNIHSTDLLSGGGGGGKSDSPSSMEIFGALGFTMSRIPNVERYISHALAAGAVSNLVAYKHQGDLKARYNVQVIALRLLAKVASEQGWINAEQDDRVGGPNGVLVSCAMTVIEDICNPQKFIGLSVRQWQHRLGLDNHMQWVRIWEARYSHIRGLVQELDIAAEDHIKRRV